MKKVSLQTDIHFNTNLEYDEDEYNIEYIKDENYIVPSSYFILRRVSDNKVVKVFDGRISELLQIKKDNSNYFIEVRYDMGKATSNVEVYIYLDLPNEFLNVSKYNGQDYTRIKDDNFILYKEGIEGCLFNVSSISRTYSKIYTSKDVKDIVGEDIILVDDVRKSRNPLLPTIEDRATYGIDINTHDIKTPIWSDLQQRFIPLLTEEEADKKEAYYCIRGHYPTHYNDDLNERIIKLEIQVTLDELARKLEYGPSVYQEGEFNKEFVKKFKIDN